MDIEFEETYTEYEEIDDLSALEDTDDMPQVEEPMQEGAFPQPLYQLKLEYSQETFYATTTELNLQSGCYFASPYRAAANRCPRRIENSRRYRLLRQAVLLPCRNRQAAAGIHQDGKRAKSFVKFA